MTYLAKKELDTANAAYQQGNYQEALISYEEAIKQLYDIGSQSGFSPTKAYYEALAYSHSQIIKCVTQIVDTLIAESPEDLPDYQSLMRKARHHRKDFLVAHNTLAECFGGFSRNATERLTDVFNSLAKTAEKISDAISDFADRYNDWPGRDKGYMKAVMWLQRAQKYQLKANRAVENKNSVRTELHLGCLNLMERAYYCKNDETYLNKISTYISENRLHGLGLDIDEQLELLSYELLVAVEDNDEDAIYILSQCYEGILIKDPDLDEKCSLIQDIKNLLAKAKAREEAIEPSSEPNPKKREREEVQEEDSLLAKKSKLTENITLDVPYLLDDAAQLGNDMITLTMPRPQAVLPGVSRTLPFFASLSAPKPSQFTFTETMKELSGSSNSPETLANLLIIIADFYYQSKHLNTYSPSPKAMFIACSLYEDVLELNPHHAVARNKKEEFKSTPLGVQILKLVLSDKKEVVAQQKTASGIFNHSISCSIKNVQTYLIENNQKQLDELFTKLLRFIGDTIRTEQSVGAQSEVIADIILSKCPNAMSVDQPSSSLSIV
ncbi:hypothetical protein ACD661_03305 [Legionella lytica]|uniref:Uncharacterized protein n=1 Tax=Legionella lytica TaxID=96232 RepID=A0ABW8D4F7_9GAMM